MFLWWRAEERDGTADTIPAIVAAVWRGLFGEPNDAPNKNLTLPLPELSPSGFPVTDGSVSARVASARGLASPGRLASPYGSPRPLSGQVIGWANRPSADIGLSEAEQVHESRFSRDMAEMQPRSDIGLSEAEQVWCSYYCPPTC